MRLAILDSASLYQVAEVFTYSNPQSAYPWAWSSAVEVTCSLIKLEHARIAAGPTGSRGARSIYGLLTDALASVVSPRNSLDARKLSESVINVKRWASANTRKLQQIYQALEKDSQNFQRWIAWSVKNAWPEHAARLGGLFDRSFLPQLARVLELTVDELEELWKLTLNPLVVTEFANSPPDQDSFNYIRSAYVISALLRGRFHDSVAKSYGEQILHHPLRKDVLLKAGSHSNEYVLRNTDLYFANVILASSFSEKSVASRIANYGANIQRARNAYHAEKIDLRPAHNEDNAVRTAIEAAKKADIAAHPQWVEQAFDAGFALGVGVLTSFFLSNWDSLVASGVGYGASKTFAAGNKVARKIYGGQKFLHELAVAGPGRIEPVWKFHGGVASASK